MIILVAQNTAQMGGVPMQTLELMRYLIGQGHKVHLFTGQGELIIAYRELGVEVITDAPRHDLDWRYIQRMRRYINDHDIEVVLANMLKSVCNGLVASKLAGCPCITNLHGNLADWEVPFYKKLINIVVHASMVNILASRMVSISHASAYMAVHKELIWPNKIAVIPNGVDTRLSELSDAYDFRQRFGLDRNILLLGYLGRLSEEKGIIDLIEGFAELAHRRTDVDLMIGGSGELLESLQQLCQTKGIEGRVHFAGQVSEAQRASFYAGLDLFIFPSRRDGFGLTLVEAMTCSCAVVANDLPVTREILDNGQFGAIVNCRKPIQLAGTIDRLLNQPEDRASIGLQARQWAVEQYGAGICHRRYAELLASAARKKS